MLDWLSFGRDQAIRVALVIALLAGATAAAFGVGYRSSDAVLGDGSAYVQKGHTVVHVNAESGKADAEAARDLATGRQRLEVVQVRPGDVYVVNNATGEVWRLPTDTMQPAKVDTGAPAATPGPPAGGEQGPPPPADKPKTQLVSGGGSAYLHDPGNGTLARLDGQRTTPVTLPSRADAVVVDAAGKAWVLSKAEGVLHEVDGVTVRGTRTVSLPGEAARLTLASGRPVIFLPERDGDGLIRVIKERGELDLTIDGQPDGALQIARPSNGPSLLVTLSQRDDTLTTVDLDTGQAKTLRLEGRDGPRSYGSPVIAKDHVYIPDFNRRQIIVVRLNPLRQIRSVAVPGREPIFDVFERDGRVWVNDPFARTLLTFAGDKWSEPDGGDRPGVDKDGDTPQASKSPSKPPPATSATPAQPGRTGARTNAPRTNAPPPPPKRVTVPSVVGLTGAEACNRITALELICQPPVTRQQVGCETGKALESTPAAGSVLPVKDRVTVVVCGPASVPGPLLGMPVDQACRTVEVAGLICARRDGGPAPTPTQVGAVSGQNPLAGAQIPNGGTVEVAYFTSVIVPQVTGMSVAQACATLQAQGLRCAEDPNEVTWEANVVHAQSIAPGTPVAVGTAVGIVYQGHAAPVKLNRWKASGQEVRFLSIGGSPPPGGWDPQGSIGGAYPVGVPIAGVVPVYQFVCSGDCGGGRRDLGYYYSRSSGAPTRNWSLQGAAFSCFNHPVPGTTELVAMFKESSVAWAFAPRNGWEYKIHFDAGYRDRFAVCWIWHGVPGFP